MSVLADKVGRQNTTIISVSDESGILMVRLGRAAGSLPCLFSLSFLRGVRWWIQRAPVHDHHRGRTKLRLHR